MTELINTYMKHTALDRTPYTYAVLNKNTGKRYYGCRYAKNCHPNDLWKTYFTSSKIIKSLVKDSGIDCWEIQIRQVFNDIISCKFWEEKVLRRLGIPKNDKWYNQSIGGKSFLLQGEALERQKKIVSKTMKQLHSQPEYKEWRKTINEKRWACDNAKEIHGAKIKEYWNDPIWVEKVIQQRIELHADPEFRKRKSEIMIEVWKRPDYVEKHTSSMKIVRSSEEWLDNNRQHMRDAWNDPVKRNNMIKNRKPASDEANERRSKATTENNKRTWADPEIRNRRISKLKETLAKKKAAKIAASIIRDNTVN